ncbi:polyA polymerase family protein [Oceanicola granulosus HTCC2516]|uniref:PolyA polymerase family protein n=1 Tax=Oceanicola granulosus (strain ATCC BAA-861 / DSM 15982 / KCTC 12143 / HTCC2516) TaxID=314256 RepID=Q2CJS2_OCEGH|nr:CCA tRNA nucleotidyltransferase [Oceanicola granulosus]EAR53067.1 polyA polymerase family protein [Oceanicola granulosus HTCC2516]
MTRLEAEWLTRPASRVVCNLLTDAGYQAWFVGGCVRNALIGAPVSDLDLATNAHPERVLALAEAAGLKAIPTGIAHGTVTLVVEGAPYEVTTFRRDVETDGRRAVVAFADSLEEDARRRDFTMNALYAAPDGTIADPIGGLPDLRRRQVRFIGDAEARIREDYLRILRFFRFHAWYGDAGAGLDADGLAACAQHVEGVAGLSRERIGHEMLRLLAAPDPAPAVAAMEACGALAQVLPGAGAGQLAVLVDLEERAGLAPGWPRRLAALGGQDADTALRLSKDEAKRLRTLREALGSEAGPGELGYRLGAAVALDVLALRGAMEVRPVAPEDADATRHGAKQTFPLTAADLIDRHQGPALGQALRDAEARWIASGFALGREALLA